VGGHPARGAPEPVVIAFSPTLSSGDLSAELATSVIFCQNPYLFRGGQCFRMNRASRSKDERHGETNDALNNPNMASDMKIPGAQKVVIPNAGHAANLDRPEAFNRAVVEFLSGLSAVG